MDPHCCGFDPEKPNDIQAQILRYVLSVCQSAASSIGQNGWSMPDTLTILTDSRIFAKRLTDEGVGKADRTPRRWQSWEETPCESFRDLHRIVTHLSQSPGCLVIHEAISPTAVVPIRRSKSSGDLVDRPRQWVCVDVDKVPTPPGLNPLEDPERAAVYLRSLLPDGLAGAQAIVHLTASTTADQVSGHVWYWLVRPVPRTELKRVFSDVPSVDLSLWDPCHPIYTADPIVVDRSHPSVALTGRRVHALHGTAPELVSADRRHLEARATAALAAACEAVEKNQGARHPVVNARAYAMGRLVAAGALEFEATKLALIRAATRGENALPRSRAEDEVTRALNDGIGAGPDLDLQRTAKGAIKATESNAVTLLRQSPWGSAVYHDVLADRVLVGPPIEDTPTPRTDVHDLKACIWLQQQTDGVAFSSARAHEALGLIAHESPRDALAELVSAEWDGQERMATWLTDFAGADDSEYTRGVARYTLCAMVARQLAPGMKADMAPVLIGPQGAGKSTLWRTLAGAEYYRQVEIREGRDPNTARMLQGCLIAEDDELRSLEYTSVAAVVKSFLSATHDAFRRPYARNEVIAPRRFLVVGSTNHPRFLSDPSGNRRFLPVRTGENFVARLPALGDVRRQLFAEAREWLAQGGTDWHVVPNAIFAQEQSTARDPAQAEALRIFAREQITAYDLLQALDIRVGTQQATRVIQWLDGRPDLCTGATRQGDPLYGTPATKGANRFGVAK